MDAPFDLQRPRWMLQVSLMPFDPLPCLQLPGGGESLPRGLSGRWEDGNVDHLTGGSQNSVKRVSGKMFCSKML